MGKDETKDVNKAEEDADKGAGKSPVKTKTAGTSTTTTDKIKALQDKIKQQEKDINALESEKQSLQTKITKYEDDSKVYAVEKRISEDQLTTKQNEIEKLTTSKENLRVQYGLITTQKSELETKIRSLDVAAQEHNTAYTELEGKRLNLQTGLAASKQEVQRALDLKSDKEIELNQRKAAYEKLDAESKCTAEVIAGFASIQERYAEEIRGLKTSKTELTDELEEAKSLLKELPDLREKIKQYEISEGTSRTQLEVKDETLNAYENMEERYKKQLTEAGEKLNKEIGCRQGLETQLQTYQDKAREKQEINLAREDYIVQLEAVSKSIKEQYKLQSETLRTTAEDLAKVNGEFELCLKEKEKVAAELKEIKDLLGPKEEEAS